MLSSETSGEENEVKIKVYSQEYHGIMFQGNASLPPSACCKQRGKGRERKLYEDVTLHGYCWIGSELVMDAVVVTGQYT